MKNDMGVVTHYNIYTMDLAATQQQNEIIRTISADGLHHHRITRKLGTIVKDPKLEKRGIKIFGKQMIN